MNLMKTLHNFIICWVFLFSSMAWGVVAPPNLLAIQKANIARKTQARIDQKNQTPIQESSQSQVVVPCSEEVDETISERFFNFLTSFVTTTSDESCQQVQARMSADDERIITDEGYDFKNLCEMILDTGEGQACSDQKVSPAEYSKIIEATKSNEGLRGLMANDFGEKMKRIMEIGKMQAALSFDPAAVLTYAEQNGIGDFTKITDDLNSCQADAISELLDANNNCEGNEDSSKTYYNDIVNASLSNCRKNPSKCGFDEDIPSIINAENLSSYIAGKLSSATEFDTEDDISNEKLNGLTSNSRLEELSRTSSRVYLRSRQSTQRFPTAQDVLVFVASLKSLNTDEDQKGGARQLALFLNQGDESDIDEMQLEMAAAYLGQLNYLPSRNNENFSNRLFNDNVLSIEYPSASDAQEAFDRFIDEEGAKYLINQTLINSEGSESQTEINKAANAFKAKKIKDAINECKNIKNDLGRMFCGEVSVPTSVTENIISNFDFNAENELLDGRNTFHSNFRLAQLSCVNLRWNEVVDLRRDLGEEDQAIFSARCRHFENTARQIFSAEVLANDLKDYRCSVIANRNTPAAEERISNDGITQSGRRRTTGNFELSGRALELASTPFGTEIQTAVEAINAQTRGGASSRFGISLNNNSAINNNTNSSISSSSASMITGNNMDMFQGNMFPVDAMGTPLISASPEVSDINESYDGFVEQQENLSPASQTLLEELALMRDRLGSLESELQRKEQELRDNKNSEEPVPPAQSAEMASEIEDLRKELEAAKLLAEQKVNQIKTNESSLVTPIATSSLFPSSRSASNAQSAIPNNSASSLARSTPSSGLSQGPSSPQAAPANGMGPVLYTSSTPISSSPGVVTLSSAQVQNYATVSGYNVAEISQRVSAGRPVVVETEDGKLLCEKSESALDGIECRKINVLDGEEAERAIAEEERQIEQPGRDRTRYDALKSLIDEGKSE